MNKNLDKLVINYFEMSHYFFVVTFILHMFTTKMVKTEAEITLESVSDGIKYCFYRLVSYKCKTTSLGFPSHLAHFQKAINIKYTA